MSLVINLVIGLPGSGKTYLANKLGGYVVDDIRGIDELPNKVDKPWTITDPNFCGETFDENSPVIRALKSCARSAGATDIEFRYHYFENNPEQCRKNVKYRDDGRNVEATIARFTRVYNPPEDALKVWEGPK